MEKLSEQESCRRCGTCCIKGGPALHGADIELLQIGKLQLADLITIRQGEYAFIPPAEKLKPITQEIVKIKGIGREWTCAFYDAKHKGCGIYDGRPLACIALKCWQPAESLLLLEKDLLDRSAIIGRDSSVLAILNEHGYACPIPDLNKINRELMTGNTALISELDELVNLDLRYRQLAMQSYEIKLEEEMFYFGRPLFQILAPIGCKVVESGGRVSVSFVTIQQGQQISPNHAP